MQRIVGRAARPHDRFHQSGVFEGRDDLALQQGRQAARPLRLGEIGELFGTGADDDALGIERSVGVGSATGEHAADRAGAHRSRRRGGEIETGELGVAAARYQRGQGDKRKRACRRMGRPRRRETASPTVDAFDAAG